MLTAVKVVFRQTRETGCQMEKRERKFLSPLSLSLASGTGKRLT